MTFSTIVTGGPDDEVTDTGTERRFQPPESGGEPTQGGERSLRRSDSADEKRQGSCAVAPETARAMAALEISGSARGVTCPVNQAHTGPCMNV